MFTRTALLTFLAASLPFAAPVRVPDGTQVQIRLTHSITTSGSKPKQPVEGTVISPVLMDGEVVILPGTTITGQVKTAKQPTKPDEQAILDIQFQEMRAPGAKQKVAIAAKVLEVDNARESVDRDGRILGILQSQTASSRLDQGINKLSQRYPELGELLGAAKTSIVKESDPNITYDPGVEMTIELTKPVQWNTSPDGMVIRPVTPEAELTALVNAQPMQTMAERPRRPSDLVTIMFLGSREYLENAFQAAGWSTAAKLDETSKLETFRAIVELRGYKEAPMSTLLLEGVPPDMVFQKQNNTFAQRHHLRIWRRPGRFNGRDIWVCSATHDIGIDFSQENRTFIHRVDPQIDKERAKVVGDLLFTGLVKGLSLVERPGIPRDGANATGDPFETDGKMAVIEF